MNILDILLNLYVNKGNNLVYSYKFIDGKKTIITTKIKGNWINTIDKADIQPFVIQKWLVMDDGLRNHVRWLDKYVFVLENNPKMYLSLVWSIMPKTIKPPFVRYIKKIEEDEEYSFILDKVRKHYKLSDNDYNYNKERILTAIKNDMVNWFSFYGIAKQYWKKYYLKFDLIKEFGGKRAQPQKGLEQWGLG